MGRDRKGRKEKEGIGSEGSININLGARTRTFILARP